MALRPRENSQHKRETQCTELNAGALAAPEKTRSKNERLSAQSFMRRYEMVRNTITDRAPRVFKEKALGSRRAKRASPEKADHSEQVNQTPSQPGGVVCALHFFPAHDEGL